MVATVVGDKYSYVVDTTDHSDERVTDMAIRRDPDRYAADMVGEKYVGDITDYSGGHVIDMAARRDWGWI
ncbi:hypothetical protein J6590_088202, partial [Homalodisca vitripennis]